MNGILLHIVAQTKNGTAGSFTVSLRTLLGAATLLVLGFIYMRPHCYEEVDGTRGVSLKFDYTSRLTSVRSKFQHIEVYDTPGFGKVLVIDNDLMLTEKDEFSYHEMAVHVPLNYLPAATKVLVIGGGDGGVVQQVLRHKNVQKVTIVEIDPTVVQVCRDFFPSIATSFDSDRVQLVHADAAKWVARSHDDMDVVIIDSTEFGAAESLFTESFYRHVRDRLRTKQGILVFNLTSLSWHVDVAKRALDLLLTIFTHCAVYQVFQPTYMSGHYSYMFCSDGLHPLKHPVDWSEWQAKSIPTRYYNSDVHYAAFALPLHIKDALGISQFVPQLIPNKV